MQCHCVHWTYSRASICCLIAFIIARSRVQSIFDERARRRHAAARVNCANSTCHVSSTDVHLMPRLICVLCVIAECCEMSLWVAGSLRQFLFIHAACCVCRAGV